MRAQEAQINAHGGGAARRADTVVSRRTAAEAALATEEQELRAAVRAAADRREGVVRLQGQVNAARSRAEARASEIERLRIQAGSPGSERPAPSRSSARSSPRSPAWTRARSTSTRGSRRLRCALGGGDQRIAELTASEAEIERRRAGLAARVDTLEPMITVADAAGAARRRGGAGSAGTARLRDPGRAGLRGGPRGRSRCGRRRGPGRGRGRSRWPRCAGWLMPTAAEPPLLVPGLGRVDRSSWPALPAGARYAIDCLELAARTTSRPSTGQWPARWPRCWTRWSSSRADFPRRWRSCGRTRRCSR